MDKNDCLKTLTDNIVKKQNESILSINNLCRKADAVSSDISNLINSLDMIGNSQYAENRVQDDLADEQKQVKSVPISSELKLSSILLKATELVFNNENDKDNNTPPSPEEPSSPDMSLTPEEPQEPIEPKEVIEPQKPIEPQHSHMSISLDKPKTTKPIAIDRVKDILQRYSLYDDDDDDEDNTA